VPPNSVATSAINATSWHLAAVIANAAFVGDFYNLVYTNMFPHILWRQSRPLPIIWAPAGGLRKCTARSYCKPCMIAKMEFHFFSIYLKNTNKETLVNLFARYF
jgi:hypothetical protein